MYNENQNVYYPPQQQYQQPPQKFKLPIYNTILFKFPNPRSGVMTLEIDPKSGNIYLTLSPAIPNNPGINARGNIPKGAKCFDYDRKVSTSLTHSEICVILQFLKNKIYGKPSTGISSNDVKEIKTNLRLLMNGISSGNVDIVKNSINIIQNLVDVNSGSSIAEEECSEIPPLYRKSNGKGPNKVWNINWEENKKVLYIRCTLNGDKNTAIYMGLSKKNIISFYNALNSYIISYPNIMTLSSVISGMETLLSPNQNTRN